MIRNEPGTGRVGVGVLNEGGGPGNNDRLSIKSLKEQKRTWRAAALINDVGPIERVERRERCK